MNDTIPLIVIDHLLAPAQPGLPIVGNR